MKKLLLICLLLLSHITYIHAQALSINTTRFVGGDASCGPSESRYSIATKDGGVLFVGLTTCYSGGGNIPPNFPDAGSAIAGNLLIGKIDSNLNVSWVKVYGGTQFDCGTGAVQTPDGGYAVLGYTYSNDSDVSGNHGNGDLWLIRINDLGNLLWQKCYGSTYDEQAVSIALSPDNGFIMLGISNGSGEEVPMHYGTEFNYNWFVVKTDSAGNMQWGKTIGGTGDGSDGSGEQGYGSIFYNDGGYYFVSTTNSSDHDCTDTFWHLSVNTGYDYYMFKLDTAGNILWDSSYGGGGSDIAYQAIWDNRDSSIVINGSTTSNNYMITGNHGGSDMGVMKIDKNGTFEWAKCLGSPNNESGNSICTATFGYVAYGATDPGVIGQADAWLFALDNSGDTFSSHQFGGANYEVIYPSVMPFKDGYAATGGSNSTGFTEGTNIGILPSTDENVFISYINYWPLNIPNVSAIDQQISLYPNPANGIVSITFPNAGGSLNIFNYLGEKTYNSIGTQISVVINTACWASGLYIVRWDSEDGKVLTKKLIIN